MALWPTRAALNAPFAISFRTVACAHWSFVLTCATDSCLGIPMSHLSKQFSGCLYRSAVKGLAMLLCDAGLQALTAYYRTDDLTILPSLSY